MGKEEGKSIVFLGNGFDKALGYKTGYDDFYKSKQFRKLFDTNNALVESIRGVKSELWSDLENGLYKYSLLQTLTYGSGNKCMAEQFEKEFTVVRKALFEYIKDVQGSEQFEDGRKTIEKLIPIWKRLSPRVVTFNYSFLTFSGFSEGYDRTMLNKNDSYNNDILDFQHGAMYDPHIAGFKNDESIVLGIDDEQKVEELHGFLYKSRQKRESIEKLKEWMDGATTYIVFGCSMGDSDAFYFKELFKSSRDKKKYLIYGKGERNMSDLTAKVEFYSGGLEKFREHNVVEFLDCEKEDETLKRTEQLLDVHN